MKNKVDTVIYLRMGKTYTVKTLSGDFKVTTVENLLLSQQAVTSKGIFIPIPNWTCSVVTVPLSDAQLPST